MVLLIALGSGLAVAGQPEAAARRIQEDILPKVILACGLPLSIRYDGESLRKHNRDIAQDQTGGENECNEPLRLLWYACGTPTGKAAVKAARISAVTCLGVPGSTGSLTMAAGTLTTGRAFEEKEPFRRTRKQFEALLKSGVRPATDDPYVDEQWRALADQPNPVTSTTTYCLVNDQKVAFDENAYSPFFHRKQDARIKCWKDGAPVVDLVLVKGRKSGFLTQFYAKGSSRRTSYRDDKRHGEEKTLEEGKVKNLAFYENDQKVWEKELHPDGRLRSYWHQFADGRAEVAMMHDGHVHRLSCVPGAKADAEFRKVCGFEKPETTSVYDGTKKVARIETWQDGVLQKQAPGTSAYGRRNEVAFKNGKKHGEERLFDKDGRLIETISWKDGLKDGRAVKFAAGAGEGAVKPSDATKMTTEELWSGDQLRQSTTFYLNGNPKRREVYDGPKDHLVKRAKEFWDTGKLAGEGDFVRCGGQSVWGNDGWCENGVHKTFFESGAPASEAVYVMGKRQGSSKRWWPDGKAAAVEEYADDKPTRAKRWDKDGKVLSDEEFEADGSRKLKR